MTTFSSQIRSGQSYTGVYTDAFSQHHRIFRCLGLAGPLVLFSLNSSTGPTRQSHTFVSSSSRNRRPSTRARTPLRRRHSCAVPPPPLTRRLLATPSRRGARALHCAAARARTHLSCAAAPQPYARPRRACATHAPPLTAADGLSPSASKPPPHSAAPLLLPRASIHARFEFSPPWVRVPARCSRNCLLGVFFVYFSTDTWISKGMVLPHLACVVSSSSYPFYTCLHISLP